MLRAQSMRRGDGDIFDSHASLQVRKDLHVYRKYGRDEKLRSLRTLICSERVIEIKVLTDLSNPLFRTRYRHLGPYGPRNAIDI